MTQLAFADRAHEVAQNVGADAFVELLGAAAGNLRTFVDAGLDGKTVPYCIEHRFTGQWEIGYGLFTGPGATLMRAVVFCNSEGTTSLIDFANGPCDVWNDLPAEKIIAADADSDHVTLPGGITVNGPIIATGPIEAPGGITGPVPWSNITGTPTTVAGYGITDAYTKSQSDARFAPIAVPWASIINTPTTLAGYGITDAFTKSESDARYLQTSDQISWGQITNTPTTLAGYGITDAYTKAQADARFAAQPVPWNEITNKPTTLAGYGITDAYTKSQADSIFAFKTGPFAWTFVTLTPTTLAGYGITDAFTKTESDARYLQPGENLDWTDIVNTPTTIAGYGIIDAYTKVESDARFAPIAVPWATITGTPTTIAGYGITDAFTKTESDARYLSTGDALDWADIINTPTTLAGYGITDAFTQAQADARYVQSLIGTAGRITISGTHSSPIINLDPAYVGQFSITTLGTITTGVWKGATIAETFGGTGQAAYTVGDVLYASAADTLSKRAIGTTKQVLTVIGGLPTWYSLTLADIGGGGAIIPPTSGGTGQGTYVTGDILYASAADTLARRAIGTPNQFLVVTGGVPTWHTLAVSDIGGGAWTGTLSNKLTFGAHLTPAAGFYDNSAAVTLATDATAVNTVSTIMARGAAGEFEAGAATLRGKSIVGSAVDAALDAWIGVLYAFSTTPVTPGSTSGGQLSVSYGPGGLGTTGGRFTGGHANGTIAAPTAIVNGNSIGSFNTVGYDGGLWSSTGRMTFIATENWVPSTARGTKIEFAANANGAAASVVVATFTVGGITFTQPVTAPTYTATSGPSSFQAITSTTITATSATVSGSFSAGSIVTDTIQMATAAGFTFYNAVATPLATWAHATGILTHNQGIVFKPMIRAIVLDGTLSTGDGGIIWQKGGLDRWKLRMGGNPESTGNVGTDLVIDAIGDDGATGLGQWFFLRRSNGELISTGSQINAVSATIGQANGTAIVTFGRAAPTVDAATLFKFINTTNLRNWQISSNGIASGLFEITPSTAVGGTVFSTPVFSLSAANGLTITGNASTLKLRAGAGGAFSSIYMMNGLGTVGHVNWSISKSFTVANALEFSVTPTGDQATNFSTVAYITNTGVITGDGLVVTGATSNAQGSISYNATYGLTLRSRTGSIDDFAIVNPAFSAAILSVPTGTIQLVTGGPMNIGGDLALSGIITMTRPDLAMIVLNATNGATNKNAQIQFQNNGTVKYQIGVNVYTGSDYFDIYSNVGGVLAMRLSPGGAMNIGGAFVAGSSITANGWLVASAAGLTLLNLSQSDAGVGSKNWVSMNNNTVFGMYAYDDGLSNSQPAIQMGRSGINVNFVTLVTSNVQRLYIDNVGVLFVGNTSTALGAAGGEIVIGNGRSILGANTANNQALPMIAIDGFNHIIMGGGSQNNLVRIGAQPAASLPAGSVNNGGGLFVDTTNSRLCYWGSNGQRYFLAGTAF